MSLNSDFERVWPWLAAAVAHHGPTHEKEHVLAALENGHAQLHPLPHGAIVTTIYTYPTGLKECGIWLAGGRLDEIVKFEGLMLDWIKGEGCTRLAIRGRKGWTRVFKPERGYSEIGSIIHRDVL